MKWLLDLTTRAKLFLGFGLMLLVLAAVIGMAYADLTALSAAQEALYAREFANAVDLKDVRANQNGVRAAVLTMMALSEPAEREPWREEIQARNDDVDALLSGLLERNRDDAALRARLEAFVDVREPYRQAVEAELIPLIEAGEVEAARDLILGDQHQRHQQMRAIADELVADADRRAAAQVAESDARAVGSGRLLLGLGAAALLMGAGMALFLNRIIARPLREITGIAERVAAGDLTVHVSADGRADEVGLLAQAFRRMVDNLREVNQELREAVGVLSAAAAEILAATTQVASAAAETATAISQTTTTVEEVKQTAHVSSQKARLVADTAQRAAQISQHGRQAADETAEGMERIRQQMAAIAERIVRLSEQGQAIGEIIATVADLAEQSNLLAVNAAIEAARAGEHGKGFGVVAQEIKSLADQSKQATAQVRSILGDVQRATGGAVMATEQGSKAVDAGAGQSAQAGAAIRQLADASAEAAQAATQIAASSQQQLVGMDQVALAMESIQQASAQNVAGTRQAEEAAQNLHALGQSLKRLVERYKV